MKGLTLAAFFGLVGYILSWGLFVPSDLRPFNVIGVVAAMSGYALGTQANKVAGWARVSLIVLSALVSVSSIVSYVIFVQRGSGDTAEVVRLAVLLFGSFFALTFLMPLAGVSIDKNQLSGAGKA